MRRIVLATIGAVGLWLLPVSAAAAKSAKFTLVQNATLVQPGNNSATAAEVASTANPWTWGAIQFSIPPKLKLRQVNDLSTDYEFVAGSCWTGSPRFEAWVSNGGPTEKIFFYIGPPPNYTGCPAGSYTNTGNLAAPASLVDDSHLPGGTFYDSYSNAQAKYGNYAVSAIYLDADGGGSQGDQTIDFDNTQIDGQLFTYEP